MPRYQVHLEIRTAKPLRAEDVTQLAGGKHQVIAAGQPRSRRLSVSMTMEGGDVVGALARSLNYVLDQLPGEVHHAEIAAAGPRPISQRESPRPRQSV